MSFAVVAIHVIAVTQFPEADAPALKWFINLAVPFYFICSGYLIAAILKGNDRYTLRKKYITRSAKIFKLFLIWIAIYLPISLYLYFTGDKSFIRYWGRYVFDIFINGESKFAWPLWYLYSMSITFLLIGITVMRRRLFAAMVCLFSLIPAIMWLDRIVNIIPDFFSLRVLSGGVYILAGWLWFRKESVLNTRLSLPLLLGISLALYFFNLPYWELAGGLAIFHISRHAITPPANRLYARQLYTTLRNLSTWIYYLHMYPVFILYVWSEYAHCRMPTWPTWFSVSGVTLLISLIIVILAKKSRKFQFLNYLIGKSPSRTTRLQAD